MELLGAGQYKLLTAAEWDAACAEEFLVTLPVGVNWAALDDQLLPRALWPQHPEERSQVPEELADRMLIFHRGVDVARMRGTYIMRKIDLLLSFFLLQPLFRLFAFIMGKLGVKKFVPDAPSYLAPVEGAAATSTDEQAQAAAAASAAAVNAGVLHEASINIERQTFARTFPDGKSVMGKLMKRVELREACFKDVVVLYRKAAPNAAVAQGEMEIVKDADPAFVQVSSMRVCVLGVKGGECSFVAAACPPKSRSSPLGHGWLTAITPPLTSPHLTPCSATCTSSASPPSPWPTWRWCSPTRRSSCRPRCWST